MRTLVAAALALATVASATTYLKETFDEDFKKRGWAVGSEWKSASEMGEWKWTSGKLGADAGIQTGPDARFHSISKQLDTPVDNKGKDLVLSYTVRFDEQEIDCGGAYIKLLPGGFDAKKFGGDTPYAIMFGPDQCGYSTKKTHVILTGADGKNHQTKKSVRMETDRNSHRYTLIVRSDNTYEVLIDGTRAEGGKLEADFDLLPPAEIPDEDAVKPSDWVDQEFIMDETGKPEGFDDLPDEVPDTTSTKPADWDDEEDGEWVPTTKKKTDIWQPKKLPNPAYKGAWVRPNKPNPARKAGDADSLHHLCNPCKAVGFELWQVKSGVNFDDIIVTDSLSEAEAFAKSTFEAKKAAEKAKLEAEEKAKKEAAEKAAEEAKKAKEETDKASKSSDEDDDDKDEL